MLPVFFRLWFIGLLLCAQNDNAACFVLVLLGYLLGVVMPKRLCGGVGGVGIIEGSCHKYHFCRDKSFCRVFRDKTRLLSRQKYESIFFCRDKRRSLSRQTHICRDNYVFVATKTILVEAPASDRLGAGKADR